VDLLENLLPMPLDEDEISDLACEYVEQEVGRFDFANNWKVSKENPGYLDAIRAWLQRIGESQGLAEMIALKLNEWAIRWGRSRWR
jgi:hypothetical protein